MDCEVFWPMTEACSSHGICDNTTGKCICDAGWSSIGDFALTPEVDCNFNQSIIVILFTIDLVCYCLTMPVIANFYVHRCRVLRNNSSNTSASFFNDSAFQVASFYLMSSICHIIFASLKINDANNRVIGGDPLTTIVFCIAVASSISAPVAYLQVSCDFLKGMIKVIPTSERNDIERSMVMMKTLGKYFYVFSLFCVFPLIFGLWFPNHMYWFTLICYIMIAIPIESYMFYGLIYIVTPVTNEIKKHIQTCEDNQSISATELEFLKKLHGKIELVKYFGYSTTAQMPMLFLAMGIWPLISRNGTYIWSILSIIGCSSALHVVSLSNTKKSKDAVSPANSRKDSKESSPNEMKSGFESNSNREESSTSNNHAGNSISGEFNLIVGSKAVVAPANITS